MPRIYSDPSVQKTATAILGKAVVAMTGADQAMANANPNRSYIVITYNGAGPAFLQLDGTTVATLNSGIRLTNAQPPLILENFTGPIRIIGVAAELVTWAEY